jgi:AmmeMemoRadiSam system protein A
MATLLREEKVFLLGLARKTIEAFLQNGKSYRVDPSSLPRAFVNDGAVFVTLTKAGVLRGCIGSLQAFQPLYQDVQERAIQAASEDYRFAQVKAAELASLKIEISILSQPQPLMYDIPDQLPDKIRAGIDGVILQDGPRRATFLPQVWQQLPSKEEFLSHLCAKMGASPSLWKTKMLDVQTYQVEEFSEEE